MGASSSNKMSLTTKKPSHDNWSGSNPNQYLKRGYQPQLTKYGRRKIVELYLAEKISPLRIAVRLGIPNKLVQLVLKHLCDRPVDFVWDDYYNGSFDE